MTGKVPPGFELSAVDQGTPELYAALQDAEFFLGSPRAAIGNEFFRSVPNLRLVHLISAGYDRVDIEAARKARVAGGDQPRSVVPELRSLLP